LPAAVARSLEEKRLREARARGEQAMAHLAALVESSDDAIIGTDLEGRILTWNPAAGRMLGRSAAEALGCALSTLIPSAPRRLSWEEVLEKVRGGETIRNYEAGPIWRGGRQIYLSLTVSPVRDSQGRVASVAAIARDITRHRHLEYQLRLKNQILSEQNRRVEAANRMKSEFLAGMSHELRTPLNSVIGLAEMMYDGKLGPVSEHTKEYLGDILDSSRHLLRLINDVLDLSKVEAGRLEFRPEPVALDRLIDEARDALRLLAARKQIEVAVEVTPEVKQVVADAARLKQVLYN
jgi:PAS domain S-box-containing protein